MADFDDARAFWDQRYDTDEYIFGRTPNRFLTEEGGRLLPGARVLDLACGEGRNAVWLAGRGCRVTGLDIAPKAIAKARLLAADVGVEVDWHLGDVRGWGWAPDAFDAVISIFIQFASPAERTRLFDGIHETLVPGGLFLLQGYTPRQLEFRTGGPGNLDHLYTREMLEKALARFELLVVREHEDILSEGTKHVGRSALVDIVARKPAAA